MYSMDSREIGVMYACPYPVSFDFFAVHEICSIFLRNHISVAFIANGVRSWCLSTLDLICSVHGELNIFTPPPPLPKKKEEKKNNCKNNDNNKKATDKG